MVVKFAKCYTCGKLYVVGTSHYHAINISSGNPTGPGKPGPIRPIHC